jgi:hypothetical protein
MSFGSRRSLSGENRSGGNAVSTDRESDLPKLAAPARRALAHAGYTHLEQLADVSELEISGLHGMGPNALGALREALAQRGLSFR